ncbi:conjugal transfer protein TraO [Chitinophaga caeni]|uniref:Conjugal transfer protein TraO n=1 Tax=Chitinophaga caeni TaxID=2029983 RepID=A0A291QYI2_9BACT|nr:conjugal transfer protein TraO [Chitinophaga caeni]ATL48942.1 conjugal transfer protein TraO [Chitinophaga caeni]
MKRYIYTLLLGVLCCTAVQAQRMLPGQKGLELSAGTLSGRQPGSNYFLGAALTVYGKSGHYQLYGLEYDREQAAYKGRYLPLETYMAEAGYSLRLLSLARKHINLNAALSAVGGYEAINRGTALLPDGALIRSEEGFIYGAGGRLSLEAWLGDRLVVVLQGRSRLLWNTSTDQFRPSAGLGLRFNF